MISFPGALIYGTLSSKESFLRSWLRYKLCFGGVFHISIDITGPVNFQLN